MRLTFLTLLIAASLQLSHQLSSLSAGQKRRAKKREYWERHKAGNSRKQPLLVESSVANQHHHVEDVEDVVTHQLPEPSDPHHLQTGDPVMVQVIGFSPLGMNCLTVGSDIPALSYHDEAQYHAEPPQLGDVLSARVMKVRDDGKLDLTFRPVGAIARIEEASAVVLRSLFNQAATGVEPADLPLGDKSSPEEVASVLGVSKSSFKAALGKLLKMQLLETPLQVRAEW